MKKTRILLLIIIAFITVMMLSGCEFTKSKSYTFDVETGDRITVKMDTSKKYDLTSDLPIEFSKDDEVLSYSMLTDTFSFLAVPFTSTFPPPVPPLPPLPLSPFPPLPEPPLPPVPIPLPEPSPATTVLPAFLPFAGSLPNISFPS